MEIKKDLRNVVLSFGAIASVLFVGGDVYVRHELAERAEEARRTEEVRLEQERMLVDAKADLDEYSRVVGELMASRGIVNETVTAPTTTSELAEATPENTTPISASAAPVITEADLARIKAQIAEAQKLTDTLTAAPAVAPATVKAPTTTVTPVKTTTTTVKKTRVSRAS